MASKEKKLATKLVAKVAYLAMYQGVKSSYAPINVKPAEVGGGGEGIGWGFNCLCCPWGRAF